MNAVVNIALHDAATNCARDGATAVLTLRSGAVIAGTLEKPHNGTGTAHVKTPTGWATVLIEEIVAVEARA